MVAQDGIKMRGAGPGRRLETANEFQALLNANLIVWVDTVGATEKEVGAPYPQGAQDLGRPD